MNAKLTKSGFTLIEMLIAMAIVVVVLSIVNAGYFAVSKSTKICGDKMTLTWQQAILLDNITAQVRCAYAPPDNSAQSAAAQSKPKTTNENKNSIFRGDPHNPAGSLLHFLTTKQFDPLQNDNSGLFEVDYKFDNRRGALFLSQRRFSSTSSADTPLQWRQIAENIKDIRLQFFDGRQWLDKWDYNSQNNIPSAVRITIEHQKDGRDGYSCSTTAFLYCARDNRLTIRTKTALQKIK
jgi:type II secretion system protein J